MQMAVFFSENVALVPFLLSISIPLRYCVSLNVRQGSLLFQMNEKNLDRWYFTTERSNQCLSGYPTDYLLELRSDRASQRQALLEKFNSVFEKFENRSVPSEYNSSKKYCAGSLTQFMIGAALAIQINNYVVERKVDERASKGRIEYLLYTYGFLYLFNTQQGSTSHSSSAA